MSALPHHAPLRLMAWNLGHRTRERVIPTDCYRAIELLRPDVLTLNEFKDGTTRTELRVQLAKLGLHHVLVSQDKAGCNQVLVASRTPVELGDIIGPRDPDDHAFTNFLHVRHPASGLEIVGIRAPAYETTREVESYWHAMGRLLRAVSSRLIVFAGDFNLEPMRARASAYSLFSNLLAGG